MSTYISVNVVSQSLLLASYIQKNNCTSIDEIQQIKLPVYINRVIAFDFAKQCKWIAQSGRNISFTAIGKDISHRFNGLMIDPELWRLILHRYITVCQPAWAKRIPFGRKEAYLFMNEEEQRCFVEADLIDNYDQDVVEWWDKLAEAERIKKDATLDDIGRAGERMTLEYEELRTGFKPDWISIESNLAGYDILSQSAANNSEKILIEVKSSRKSMENAALIISRHEWDTAKLRNNLHRYLFYLWDLSTSDQKLAVISAEEMTAHIPDDNEYGTWESVRVPFKVFLNQFRSVHVESSLTVSESKSQYQIDSFQTTMVAESSSKYETEPEKITPRLVDGD